MVTSRNEVTFRPDVLSSTSHEREQAIVECLIRNKGNKSATRKEMRCSLTTVHDICKKRGIEI